MDDEQFLADIGIDPGEPPPPVPSTHAEGIVPLGHDRGIFYYLSRGARQVFMLSASQHTTAALLAMASLPYYWQRTQFVTDAGKIKWESAVDDLMQKCRDIGIFNPDRLRGRGAWLDDGRSVLHLGNELIIDGRHTDVLMVPGSAFVYEAARQISHVVAPALTSREANRVMDICKLLRWQDPRDAVLLAGFIVVAPICGAMKWRPSMWLTGGSKSGKTWTQRNIVTPLIGDLAYRVQSKTSEAGIRQELVNDALPVLFDESESEDGASAARIQGVLDLVRQSSSDDGGAIVKGSQNHGAKRFRIRSSFFFSSINVGLSHAADLSRVTVVSLANPVTATDADRAANAVHFAGLQRLVGDTITPAYAAGLLARSAGLMGTIRVNAETFSAAIARLMGDRRLGDQIGTLLAGAYSLHSDRIISQAQAEQAAAKHVSDLQAEAPQPDEDRLWQRITQHRVRIASGQGAAIECSIGRLIEAAADRDHKIMAEDADRELRAIGLRYRPSGFHAETAGVYVSNTHPALAAILAGSPWASGWHRSLGRLPMAQAGGAQRFGPGHVAKCVWVPWISLDAADGWSQPAEI